MKNKAPIEKHSPSRREARAGPDALKGEALQVEICRLREMHDELGRPVHSCSAIAKLVGCSAAYVAKVCSAVVEDKERFPPEVFEALLAHLRSGAEVGAALDLPGVADLFLPAGPEVRGRRARIADVTPEVALQRKRDSLRRWISCGRDAADGSQKRALYLARQEGRQRAREAA